jgi:hypothetical protein
MWFTIINYFQTCRNELNLLPFLAILIDIRFFKIGSTFWVLIYGFTLMMIFYPCQLTSRRVSSPNQTSFKIVLKQFDFQIADLLREITEVDTKIHTVNPECKEVFLKLFGQISLQPIEFTTYDLYKINYNLLAGVSLNQFWLKK